MPELSELAPAPEVATQSFEVPYETFGVTLPEQPVVINGMPYAVGFDETLLANRVRVANRYGDHTEGHRLRGVIIELGDSRHPFLQTDTSEEQSEMLFDHTTNQITVRMPGELVASSVPDGELAAELEIALNGHFERGRLQAIAYKEGTRSYARKFWSAFILGPLVAGTSAALIFAESDTGETVTAGGIGCLIGAIAVLGSVNMQGAYKRRQLMAGKPGGQVGMRYINRYVNKPWHKPSQGGTPDPVFSLKPVS
ncbi:MAG: hypothetical protein JWM81_1017 [Candidatus Saccharibacteria bacterium]|nr:hypothetical protein [Candidatus Saccharibacteria bacterium]